MVSLEYVRRAIVPLPPRLRSSVYSQVLRTIEEARAERKPEDEIEREVVDTILRELFLNLVEPIDMLENMLESKIMRETDGFKIEFSEIFFDKSFIEKTKDFRDDFWSLVEELGRLDVIRPKRRQLDWKGQPK